MLFFNGIKGHRKSELNNWQIKSLKAICAKGQKLKKTSCCQKFQCLAIKVGNRASNHNFSLQILLQKKIKIKCNIQ